MGSTELGTFPLIRKESDTWRTDLWNYISFNPAYKFSFVSSADGMYEGVMSKADSAAHYTQPVFVLKKDCTEFSTSDLFLPHPTEEDTWTYAGRADDVQNFATGEKFFPTHFESGLLRSPLVAAALCVGSMRSRAALLVETNEGVQVTSMADQQRVLDEIWPLVQELNEKCPVYARVERDAIILTGNERGLVKTAKGTVMRARSVLEFGNDLASIA